MPVAQGSRTPAHQAVAVASAAILGLAAIVFLITRFDRLGGDTEAQIDLGGPSFVAGQAAEIAPVIATDGPLLLPDPASGNRDLWLQHLSDDPELGWAAFSARSEGADPECFAEWIADRRSFVDTCDGATYPSDGEGLVQYPVSVDPDGTVVIALTPLPGTP